MFTTPGLCTPNAPLRGYIVFLVCLLQSFVCSSIRHRHGLGGGRHPPPPRRVQACCEPRFCRASLYGQVRCRGAAGIAWADFFLRVCVFFSLLMRYFKQPRPLALTRYPITAAGRVSPCPANRPFFFFGFQFAAPESGEIFRCDDVLLGAPCLAIGNVHDPRPIVSRPRPTRRQECRETAPYSLFYDWCIDVRLEVHAVTEEQVPARRPLQHPLSGLDRQELPAARPIAAEPIPPQRYRPPDSRSALIAFFGFATKKEIRQLRPDSTWTFWHAALSDATPMRAARDVFNLTFKSLQGRR